MNSTFSLAPTSTPNPRALRPRRRAVLHAAALLAVGTWALSPRLSYAAPWTAAEVRRIDVEQGRLTLRHGDMPHLDMPPMTMVFAVADRSWLHGLQIGEAVQVQIERRDGAFVVIALRTSRPEK